MDDANSQMFTLDSQHVQTSSSQHSESQEAQCGLCRRAFTPGNGVAEGFEAISICRECKRLVVDDYEATPVIRNIHRRRRQRGRGSRYGSSESIDDLFSQQFSQLIGLVRQNHEAPVDDGGDSTVTVPSRGSYPSARNWARSWRRPLSDYDSESLDHGDSLFGETDSNISFYGADSEASPDVHSLLEREVSIQLDYESHNYTDTDIDPMHAGMDQWNSDDQDEDIGWEINMRESSSGLVGPHDQMQDTFDSPSGSINSAQNSRWIHWRARHADLFVDLEELDIPPFVGNSNDYADARGFEELLEQLAETGGSRRGAPPAAASIIGCLPRVTISKSHEKNGCLVCAVCKDPLPIDSEATQLPCFHLYHPSCILPWLSARNSCPVCRYELPTDDVEYEQGKRNTGGVEIRGIQGQDREEDSFSNVLRGEQAEGSERAANNLNREGGGGGSGSGRGWFFLAAAPIVGIVGIALALWFRNSVSDGRIHCSRGEHGHQQPQRSRSISDRSRRWWLPL